ncbi:MAG: sulfotransferase [Planctomycetales bacterium]|nr:sulfotransferase [Planctomycetales bacterium]MBN8626399.1 sulfotransferase [Planctomycetota bacterium]
MTTIRETSKIVDPPAVATRGDSRKLRFYHIRNWLGMPLGVWLPLLARNRFAAPRVGQVLRQTVFSAVNSLLHRADQLIYSGRVRRAPAPEPPLFVVGHWRTGTTLLHELLVQDERFTSPSTYQVMTPHHFLLTDGWMPRLFNHALPERRPMDSMAVGFDKPQEDEFALCNLGLPSPYVKWAFPNHYPEPGLALDIEALDERERRRWVAGMRWFVGRLSYRDRRPLVLKSPTHTARLRLLAEAFPGARFLHIVRNPYEVFASTLHTWRQLWDSCGFHAPSYEGLDEYVLETFVRMYAAFERDRPLLDARQFYELRYEDLVADPMDEMRKVYARLELPDFETARPRLTSYFADHRGYRTNRHVLADEVRQQIANCWRPYFERYGYTV